MKSRTCIGWGIALFIFFAICVDAVRTLVNSKSPSKFKTRTVEWVSEREKYYQEAAQKNMRDPYKEAAQKEFERVHKRNLEKSTKQVVNQTQDVVYSQAANLSPYRAQVRSSEVLDPKAEINRNREKYKNYDLNHGVRQPEPIDVPEQLRKNREEYERKTAMLNAELARVKADQLMKANKAKEEDNSDAYDRCIVVIVDLTEMEGVLRLGSADDFRRRWHSDRWQHAKEIIRTNKIIKQLNNL